jgi:hypothetical protein
MAELLLLNPRRRRRAATGAKKRRARRRNPVSGLSALARRPRRRRNPVAAVTRRRRRNPIASLARRRSRRRNPIAMRGRRRNPIGLGSGSRGIVNMLMNAAVAGAGAIAVDVAWNQVNQRFLPATMQTQAGRVGAGDAIKAVVTAFLGGFLSRYTKGYSAKMAAGSLAVQARDVLMKVLPPSVSMQAAGLGYYSPAPIVNRSARIGPNRALNNNGAGHGMGRVSAYLPQGQTPLLNGSVRGGMGAYLRPGSTALLNGRISARQREGMGVR